MLLTGAAIAALAIFGTQAIVGTQAQQPPVSGPYRVIRTATVGGEGGFDYVYADVAGRRLYIPRSGQTPPPRIAVYDLDTLAPVGEISGFNAHGAAVDPKSGHGFATSNPVVMWDARTLATIKTIDVQGGPDGILFDPFNSHVYILSHRAPNMTVINSVDGSIAGTIDLGGAPEQAVTDGAGHIYVDIEDKGQVAVVDARTMAVTARYDLGNPGLTPAGLALDARNHILFAACRNPASMVILNSDTGKILATLPIGTGVDGATFNPNTMEAFSSQGDGTLTVVKENSPTSFAVEQTVQTKVGAKTLTLDSKTNRILLITAEFGPPPAPASPPVAGGRGRGGRGPAIPGSFQIIVVGK
jgi:DNA-binding beta-propeller fold protein YncE